MRSKRGPLGLLVLTAAFLVFAFGASSAQAVFGIEKFEALTCKTDESAPGLGSWEDNGNPCRASDPVERFYTQAAGHPPKGITAFMLNQVGGFPNFPEGALEELRTELPEGLGVNPEATPQCTRKQLSEVVAPGPPLATKCTTEVPGSFVGINYFTTLAPPPGPPAPGTEITVPVLVYNLEPEFGEPSSAGFNATGTPTILESDLDPVDQHISFTIRDIEETAPIIGSRLVFNGLAGEGYLTMPSNCAGPQVTHLDVHSHEGVSDSALFETAVGAENCENVPFDPGLETTVNSATESPEAATVDVQLPYDPNPANIQTSHLLKAEVTLPRGAGLNPSVANGLAVCTDQQFGKGTNNPIQCPAASKVGTVEVETQALPETLGGTVYVGAPLSNNPSSGNQFRIFIHVDSPKFGVNVRLLGNVFPDLDTGQLTAVVDDNPQAPFESFKVHIDGGPRGALTTPGTCGPNTTSATFTPWAANGNETRTASFELDTAGYGGDCPKTLADRQLTPGYLAAPETDKAGAFTPFRVNLFRADGEQEIKRIDVDLPPGMVASLKGVEYCPQHNIDTAGALSGTATTADPQCPGSSYVGAALIAAGSGPQPFKARGNVYLAGPYKGAPVSLVFITPALAGPYDLGTVVVRVALHIDPETAEVHAVSDRIPDVFGGVKLSIQGISVGLERPNFTLNPTTCREPFPIRSRIFGGGGNPADAAQWQSVETQYPFRATNCKALRFKPKFFARIFGGKNQTRRAQNPKFRAILDARDGDANLRRAAFILPRATILDQSHIKTICTRVQLAANQCPKNAIYGNARATSPLLDKPLKGPVYLTSSSNELPDLLVDLKGQVPIRLRGVISSERGRLKTVFNGTPDVAVNKFILTMKGGNRGLLVNSRNLCSRQTSGFLNLLAQNSRRMKTKNLRLNIPACRGGKQN
jgi:hypothetical protein